MIRALVPTGALCALLIVSPAVAQDVTKYGPFAVNPGGWLDSGIRLRAGQQFHVETRGSFQYKAPPQYKFNSWGDSQGGYKLRGRIGDRIMSLVMGRFDVPIDGTLELGAPLSVAENDPSRIQWGAEALFPDSAFQVDVFVISGSELLPGGSCAAGQRRGVTDTYATVQQLAGEVTYLEAGASQDRPAHVGLSLGERVTIYTGPQAEVVLSFCPSGSVIRLKERTTVAIGQMTTLEGRVLIRMLLRKGEMYKGSKPPSAVQSDFSIQTPTSTTSVRGTELFMRHDEETGITTIRVEEGQVDVVPVAPGVQAFSLTGGQQVQLSEQGITPIAVTSGTAGARSSPTSLHATWIGPDGDIVDRSETRPDGAADGHFRIETVFPSWREIAYLALRSADPDGNPSGGQVWHTRDSGAWILGVVDGQRMNARPVASLGKFIGLAAFDLYAGDSGWFKAGQTFVLEMGLDGNEAIEAVVRIPGTPPLAGAPAPPAAGTPTTLAGGAPPPATAGAPPSPGATPSAPAGGAPPPPGAVVEGAPPASPVDWNTRGDANRGAAGQRFRYPCPAGGTVGPVWGTDVYTADSSVCTAAVHAGLITLASGGTVTIEMRPGEPSYRAESRNGITSWAYGPWGLSFVFPRASDPPYAAAPAAGAEAPAAGTEGAGAGAPSAGQPAAGAAAPSVSDPPRTDAATAPVPADWNTRADSHRGAIGQRFSVTCPPGGPTGPVWGTDVYTDDSSVCTAAVHAGLITVADGGTVTIEMRGGETAYQGRERNGITSWNYGSWGGSFVFPRPGDAPATPPLAGGAPAESAQPPAGGAQAPAAGAENATPGGPPTPLGGSSSQLTSFEASWIGLDADLVTNGAETRPDGSPDGHFRLDASFSFWQDVSYILVQSADEAGSPAGGQVWHSQNSSYWLLAVLVDGMNLNTRHVPLLGGFTGDVTFDLYAGDSGWFRPGQKVLVEMGLGSAPAVTRLVQIAGETPVTPPAAGAPTPPPAEAPAAGGPPAAAPPAVEGTPTAGPVDWNTRGESHRGEVGTRYTYTCPPNGTVGPVWGTDVYTDDSSVCTAAVHAGLITLAGGGTVTIEMRGGEANYRGQDRNGITSWNYGAWGSSFVFPRPGDPPATAANALRGPEICGVWRWFDRSVVVFDADGGLEATGVNAPSLMLVDRGRWELADPVGRQYRISWPVGQDLLTLSPDLNGLGGTNVGGAVQVSATRTGACGASPPSPPDDFDAHVSYAAGWVGMDADYVSRSAAATADGAADGHFTFTYDTDIGPYEIRSITVESSDSAGNPSGGQVWTTASSRYWVLGVVRQGARLNEGHVPSLGTHQGFRSFDLYAADSGWFLPGQHFVVEVNMGGDAPIRQVVRIPESFQPDVQPQAEPAPAEAPPGEELPVPTPMFAGSIVLERPTVADDEPVRVIFRNFRGDERIVVASADADPEDYIAGVWPDGTQLGGSPPDTPIETGSVAFIGFNPGEYEIRVFTGAPEDGEWPQLTEYFTVESGAEEPAPPVQAPEPPAAPAAQALPMGADAAARPQRDSYLEGETIVVDFRGFPGYAQDWIDISPVGASDESYGQWFYLGGQTAGSLQFSGLTPGTYEVRGRFNWPDGGFAVRTRSTFTVVPGQPPADPHREPPADQYRVTGLSAAWIGVDADVVSTVTVSPDGAPDGHFAIDITIDGSPLVSYATVYSSDASGSPSGGQVWHTQSPSYAVLAVSAWGHLLNDGYVSEIGRFTAGATRLDLYAFDSGWFRPGQHFVVELGFADGQKVARVVQLTGAAVPPAAEQPAAPPANQYRVTGLSFTWSGIDADVVSVGTATIPDGAADGRFRVDITIEGSVELRSVTLYSSDAQGNPQGGQVWTTASGTSWWVLGVGAGGSLLHNGQVEGIGTLQQGTTWLDLFAGNSGWFNPGQSFLVELAFADGQKAAQVVRIPDSFVPPGAAPPVTPEGQAPGGAPGACDVSGLWHGNIQGFGVSDWTFTATGRDLYAVQETGLGNAQGTGTVSGYRLQFDWRTGDFTGTAVLDLDASCTSASGQDILHTGAPGTYAMTLQRAGVGAAPAPTGGLPTQDFYAPMWGGVRLDWCLVWGGQCGEPAATEFCRQSGYTKATAWEPATDVGTQTPTFVLGTGQVCNEPACDGFTSITCTR